MPLPPYLYSYDPVGTSAANKITNELHNVAPPNNPLNANFIVPRAAPFFRVGLIVRTGTAINSPQLIEGTDYILTHPFIEASVVLNKLLYGSIMFLDRQYSGDVYLTYQTIGAGYTLDDYGIVESLTNSLYNIRLVSWTQIEGLPVSYPGMPHTHNNYEDMVGLSEVVGKLTELVAAVNAGGGNLNTLITSFQQHLTATMAHNKAQVGLSLVPNYPPATQADLTSQSNTALMTPKQTLKMLTMYGGASSTEGSGIADDDKVDKTTTVTGGGLATGGGDLSVDRIITVPKALPADVVDGTSDAKALTVASGVHLIDRWKGYVNDPVDDMLSPLVSIDQITNPGVYNLPVALVTDSVNAGKIPLVVIDIATNPDSAEHDIHLMVTNTYSENSAQAGVIQTLQLCPIDAHSANDVRLYRRCMVGTAWMPWVLIQGQLTALSSIDVDVDGVTFVYRVRRNLVSPNGITKEADGFTGNYHGSLNPMDNVYTVHFAEPFIDNEYTVSAVVNSQYGAYANSTTEYNAWADSVHNLCIVDKQPHRFSFVIVKLDNFNGGSSTQLATQFSACITFFGDYCVAQC